jgi:radical SAM protein with 4Fe4S-binding SPASM domain
MSLEKRYRPGQVVWETTLRCNLKCLHCGSSAGKARPDELTTKEALQLCEDLAELKTEGICLMGGEPFLRKDWYEISKKIKELNMKLLYISNGFNITKGIISKLIDLDPHSVSTSLDGAKAETHDHIRGVKGSFDKVMEYISLSKEADLPTTVITTISKLNLKELPELRDFLLNKHIAWQIQVATPGGRFPKKFALSEEEYYSVALFIASMKNKYTKKELPVIGAHCFGYHSRHLPSLGLYPGWNGCQAGISILSIKSNGDVIGCLSTVDAYMEGNIRKRSIIDIWNDPNAFKYNRKFKVELLGENCKGCKFGITCRGGCLGMSLGLSHKPHNHPYCFYKIEPGLFQKSG